MREFVRYFAGIMSRRKQTIIYPNSTFESILENWHFKHKLPIELAPLILQYLPLFTIYTLGANINQLVEISRLVQFESIGIPIAYKLQNESIKFLKKEFWFSCDPIFFTFLLKRFNYEFIDFLSCRTLHEGKLEYNLYFLALFNRDDLIRILFSYTSAFNSFAFGSIGNVYFYIMDIVCLKFIDDQKTLNLIKYLHFKGASCSTFALDWSSKNGNMKVVHWLYRNRIEGGRDALHYAVSEGHLHVIRYLFENKICIDAQLCPEASSLWSLY